MRKTISFILATTVAVATLAVTHSSRAGSAPEGNYAQCNKNADGSGYCYGNLLGFQQAPSSADAASFTVYDSGYAIFWARLNGSFYACSKGSPTSLWYQAASLPANVSFEVEWNSGGQCTFFDTQNTSFN